MDARDILASLFQHASWANTAVLASLRNSPAKDPAALGQIAHVLGAEHVWLARIRGEVPRVAVWPSLTLEECDALADENHRGFIALLALADQGLEREVTYVNSRDVRSRTASSISWCMSRCMVRITAA